MCRNEIDGYYQSLRWISRGGKAEWCLWWRRGERQDCGVRCVRTAFMVDHVGRKKTVRQGIRNPLFVDEGLAEWHEGRGINGVIGVGKSCLGRANTFLWEPAAHLPACPNSDALRHLRVIKQAPLYYHIYHWFCLMPTAVWKEVPRTSAQKTTNSEKFPPIVQSR